MAKNSAGRAARFMRAGSADSVPRRSGWGSLARLVVIGLVLAFGVGATGVSAVERKPVIVQPDPGEPLLVWPTHLPKGMCLAWANRAHGLGANQTVTPIYRRGDAFVVFAASPIAGVAPPFVATAFVVGRARGLVYRERSSVIAEWSLGGLNLTLSGRGLARRELLDLVRQVQVRNGKPFMDPKGFTEVDGAAFDAQRVFVNAGPCASNRSATAAYAQVAVQSGAVDDLALLSPVGSRTSVSLHRPNATHVAAFRDGDSDVRWIEWLERGRKVVVWSSLPIDVSALIRVADGVVIETPSVWDRRSARITPLVTSTPGGNYQSWPILTTTKLGTVVRVRAEGAVVCLAIENGGGANSGCFTASVMPAATVGTSGESEAAGVYLVGSKVARASLAWPGGKSTVVKPIPIPRMPNAQIVLVIRPVPGPIPESIAFYDRQGNVLFVDQ